MDFIFSDDVRKLCLSCNVKKKQQINGQIVRKEEKQADSNRF